MDATPRGHHVESVDLGHRLRQTTILAYPKYRPGPTGWEPTRERFRGGGPADWVADESVHALTVARDGRLLLEHAFEVTPHRLGTRLEALGVLCEDGTFDARETPLSAVPTLVAENRLRWADYFDGIDLDVVYVADQVRTVIRIRDDARDRLLQQRRRDSRLAFLWRFDAAGLNHRLWTRDRRSVDLGAMAGTETSAVRFTRGGRTIMTMPTGVIRHVDDRPTAPVRDGRRFVFRTRGSVTTMLEVVPWTLLETAPEGTLVLNATQTYQQGTDSYSGCEDVFIEEDDSTNYGNDTILWPCNDSGTTRRHVLIRFAIGTLGTVTAAKFTFTKENGGDDGTNPTSYCKIRELKQPWTEGGAAWDKYDGSNEWSTYGANHETDDIGSTDLGDDEIERGSSGTQDIEFNAAGVTYVNGAQGSDVDVKLHVYETPGGAGWIQEWSSSESSTTADRPILTVTYTGSSGFKTTNYLRHRKYLDESAMPYDIP